MIYIQMNTFATQTVLSSIYTTDSTTTITDSSVKSKKGVSLSMKFSIIKTQNTIWFVFPDEMSCDLKPSAVTKQRELISNINGFAYTYCCSDLERH